MTDCSGDLPEIPREHQKHCTVVPERAHRRPLLLTPALPLPLNVFPAASVQTMPWQARMTLELGAAG